MACRCRFAAGDGTSTHVIAEGAWWRSSVPTDTADFHRSEPSGARRLSDDEPPRSSRRGRISTCGPIRAGDQVDRAPSGAPTPGSSGVRPIAPPRRPRLRRSPTTEPMRTRRPASAGGPYVQIRFPILAKQRRRRSTGPHAPRVRHRGTRCAAPGVERRRARALTAHATRSRRGASSA